ncbi:hypothetical protein J6590_037565 [Homalodisca vitripennis]|nr:hypothetical protein J6590_037565 [Homalodisca vitripennis]
MVKLTVKPPPNRNIFDTDKDRNGMNKIWNLINWDCTKPGWASTQRVNTRALTFAKLNIETSPSGRRTGREDHFINQTCNR